MCACILAMSESRETGPPVPFSNTHAGVWLCQTSVCPMITALWRSPKATYRSAGPKLNCPGRGSTQAHFNTFSGEMLLKCRAISASPMLSRPSIWRTLIAAPTRNDGAKALARVRGAGAGCERALVHPAASGSITIAVSRADETAMIGALRACLSRDRAFTAMDPCHYGVGRKLIRCYGDTIL